MFKQKSIVALVSLALSPALFAAQTPVQAEEVVVTATRTATPVSKVLSDVTVITREEIEQSGVDSLPQILSRVPGVEVSQSGGKGKQTDIFLRGTNSRHALILVDGVRIVSATNGASSLQFIPVEQIDRIEVLMGPASSLYGADAVGGVIQVFTRQGKGAPSFYANFGAGSHDFFRLGIGAGGKVDNTAFSVNISREQTNGFSAQNNKGSNFDADNDGYKNNAYTANLTQTISAGHDISLRSFQTFAKNEYDPDQEKVRLTGQSIESKNAFTDEWTSTLRFSRSQD
ncbi:TonB-dependent receptor, partial [Craterilacuibacter sp.]|uniref:TonB-dependent receptor n=1 Tax=Craterilacuibacter sp. TaxID=2870909 RepID=UPI003F3E57B7